MEQMSLTLGWEFDPTEYQREAKVATVCRKGITIGARLLSVSGDVSIVVLLRYWSVVGAMTPGELRKTHRESHLKSAEQHNRAGSTALAREERTPLHLTGQRPIGHRRDKGMAHSRHRERGPYKEARHQHCVRECSGRSDIALTA